MRIFGYIFRAGMICTCAAVLAILWSTVFVGVPDPAYGLGRLMAVLLLSAVTAAVVGCIGDALTVD